MNKFSKKTSIFSTLSKINSKILNILLQLNNIDNNIAIDNYNPNQIHKSTKWCKSFSKNVTMNYKYQLKNKNYFHEDEIQDINIMSKNNKIQYCSIDLLLYKICRENTFNFEVNYGVDEKMNFNFINAFIFQCFGFIDYETLIYKLLDLFEFLKNNSKLKSIMSNRIIKLIFKISKYLLDHEKYECSYFQFHLELKNKLKNFLKDNNMKSQINSFNEYQKENNIINNKDNINEDNSVEINIKYNKPKINITSSVLSTVPQAGFEFNILDYKENDIAKIISYISIKNYKNLFEHLYEFNPTIKNKIIDAKHIFSIIDFSNKLTNFLIEEVFSYDLIQTRINIIEKIILILLEVRSMNNFNDLLPIYSALISISFRLKNSWSQIDSKLKNKFKEIENFCSIKENYKNIRDQEIFCQNSNRFYIPYIGIILKRINFYDEGVKYISENGLVCIEKIIVTQKEIEEFKYRLKLLGLSTNGIIESKFLNNNGEEFQTLKKVFYNLNPKELNLLENISSKLEPEFTLYKVPDQRKRKTKTDLYINSTSMNQIL